MRYIALAVLLALPGPASAAQKPLRMAVVCFAKGEQVSGLNKICYYDCLGSMAAITIGAAALCPVSINR